MLIARFPLSEKRAVSEYAAGIVMIVISVAAAVLHLRGRRE